MNLVADFFHLAVAEIVAAHDVIDDEGDCEARKAEQGG